VTRVGFFGILGAGNIGNDAQFESILEYLRNAHPEAALEAMCSGPDRVRSVYGIDAVPLNYHLRKEPETWEGRSNQGGATTRRGPGLAKAGRIALEIAIDFVRIASWTRKQDVVIVPGAGVLESTLLLRPWGTPLQMFAVCLSGRMFRTKVALVCVGATVSDERLIRLLFTAAAKLAYYRSYRDDISREAMRQQGVDTTRDQVYADLAFGIPPLGQEPGDSGHVGVGVMAFYGNNADRKLSKVIHESYMQKLKLFVRQLVDSGRKVRLFVGDSNGSDDSIAQEIIADLRSARPDADHASVTVTATRSFADLMQAMAPVGVVVATRYHNVICALKLAKPTVAIAYSPKHQVLMADLGVPEYCQNVKELDVDLLIKQLDELEERSAEVRETMKERHAAKGRLLQRQFAELSAVLFGR
jgi:polysaccharide pyruvyl transferase WcaK-like protein